MDVHLSLPSEAIVEIYGGLGLRALDPSSAVAYAPEFSDVRAWFERIWDEVRTALDDVRRQGQAKIDEWMPRIQAKLEEAKRTLGARSEQLMELLQKHLIEGARLVQSALLALLPNSVAVEAASAPLREVTIQCQLSYGSDVTMGINWALKMAAGATMSVSAKYALP
jgi:hypothetical protein